MVRHYGYTEQAQNLKYMHVKLPAICVISSVQNLSLPYLNTHLCSTMAQEDLPPEKRNLKISKRKTSPSNSHRPRKKTKILLEDDSEGEGSLDSYSTEVSAKSDNSSSNDHILAINQEFAQRFEHNKEREERQRRTSHPSAD